MGGWQVRLSVSVGFETEEVGLGWGDIQDKRIQGDNQGWRDLESQCYLFWFCTVVFCSDNGEDGIDSLIQVAITVNDDIIKLVFAFELFPGSSNAMLQTI